MDWIYDQITVTGDRVGEDGDVVTEVLDLWRRNPVDCVRELIGNPTFREVMGYAPERQFVDEELLERVLNEMWTADWWWKIQVRIVIRF